MALGRDETAVARVQKAGCLDPVEGDTSERQTKGGSREEVDPGCTVRLYLLLARLCEC